MMKHLLDAMLKQKGPLQHIIPKARSIKVTGEAGGGLVKATMLGSGKLEKLEIDEKLKESEVTVIEDLVIHACNVARDKIQEEYSKISQEEMEKASFMPNINDIFEDPGIREVFQQIVKNQNIQTGNKTSGKKEGDEDE